MLLAFQLENYRSFRDPSHLVLTRSPKNADRKFPYPTVAPAVALLGSNASGKSNLLRGLRLMFRMLSQSAADAEAGLPFEPFLLGSKQHPWTEFEITVLVDDVRYEYGFRYDADRILKEWLRSWPKGRVRVLFERDVDAPETWRFGDTLTGQNQALANLTRPNALLMSTVKLLNHETLTPLGARLSSMATWVNGDMQQLLEQSMETYRENPRLLDRARRLLAIADLGVESVTIEEDEIPEEIRAVFAEMRSHAPDAVKIDFPERHLSPRLTHRAGSKSITLPFSFESVGTRNFLALLAPILKCLDTGGALIIDEIDTSLHALLVNELVRLFTSSESNPRQAQLILSTHDVTVMMNTTPFDVLSREDIWFINKNADGVSTVDPLAKLKARPNEVFSRYYLYGRYGGVPRLEPRAFVDAVADHDSGDES
ncbi:ATP/GTP-binding protein [Microbacterium sp. NPDC058389]|uniref:AAA family ATPase n=1 Tax=Microbacterium sp. NPDC058389 TaxID=3346475 RepID=UPI003665635A